MTRISFLKPSFPYKIEGGQSLLDLHVHSNFSPDGFLSPSRLLKIAKRLGIGLAICDHNEIKGSLKASEQKEVFIIPGIEVTCQNGTHLLFYFNIIHDLEEFFKRIIKPNKKNNPLVINLLPQELIERANNFSCLICAPHPFEEFRGGIQKAIQGGLLREEKVKEKIDCIEAINGMCSREHNKKAILWAQKIKKPIIAGSDGHLALQIGSVLTKINGDNAKGVFKNLKKPIELAGTEMNGIEKNLIRFRKESKIIFRKGGAKILANQIKRSLKK